MSDMSFIERLLLGLETALIGLAVVFLCLFLLIAIIKIMSALVAKIVLPISEKKAARKAARQAAREEKARAKAEQKTPAPATKAKDIEVLTPKSAPVQPEDDSELVAVLSAAVAAVLGTSASRVRIASYKKTNARSAWANAGRREQIASRF